MFVKRLLVKAKSRISTLPAGIKTRLGRLKAWIARHKLLSFAAVALGLAVVIATSSEYELVNGQVRRSKRRPLMRGLNNNYNRAMKEVFKGAAKTAADGVWKSRFEAMVAKGTPESLARLTLARKIASITLALWKKGERYDKRKVKMMHAA